MSLSHEDKLELKDILREILPDALELERARHRERMASQPAKPEPEPERETKTYLVSMAGHLIAFPSEKGRAVMSQACYARITRQKVRWSDGWSIHEALVIADSDGRLLDHAFPIVLVGQISAMVEVDEAAIFGTKTASAGG
jgi:hypothetical protein